MPTRLSIPAEPESAFADCLPEVQALASRVATNVAVEGLRRIKAARCWRG
jgi:hypothetical protein